MFVCVLCEYARTVIPKQPVVSPTVVTVIRLVRLVSLQNVEVCAMREVRHNRGDKG